MKSDSTHITVILDRTGSMESIRDDTIGGFNAFLAAQKAEPGEATLTLVQFDSQDPFEVIHSFAPLDAIPELTRKVFVPRAATPLLDALGRGINDTEQRIAALPEEARPSQVVIAVITDGEENASQEFRKDQVEKLIRARTEQDDWQFVFLSADLASIGDAMDLGIARGSCFAFQQDAAGTANAWSALSGGVSDYRAARKKKIGFQPGDSSPTGTSSE